MAFRLVFRAELRQRWKSWLALALLIALVGGFVLAATAAGRRTDSAFPRFVAAYGYDAVGYAYQPVPQLAKLPEVAFAVLGTSPLNGQPQCACGHPITPTNFSVIVLPRSTSQMKLVSGRFPDPSSPNEVLASFTLQQDHNVHIGTVIRVPFYAPSQQAAASGAVGAPPRPLGPTVAFHVVGFEASEGDFPSGTAPSYGLYATEVFARTVIPKTAVFDVYAVRLRHGAADLPRFGVDVDALNADGLVGYQGLDGSHVSIEASIHSQAIGWWVLAAMAALVGVLVIGQALARQSVVESENHPTLATLGFERPQLVALALARNVVVGIAGATGAVALATALSPLSPVGEARIAEPSTGVTFDSFVLVLGAVATVVVVVALGIWPALRAARTLAPEDEPLTSRPSTIVAHLAAMGAPPSAVIGVRHAVQRGQGRSTVPVGTALAGTVLAVMALCGTEVFGASLSYLTSSPALYGDAFQLNFSTGPSQPMEPALLHALEHDPAITGVTRGVATAVSINKVTVGALAGTALRGTLLLSTVNGHLPSGDGQIGLGTTTMRQVGARIGSVVRVTVPLPSGGRRTVPFHVVARMSLPVLGGIAGLGTGAAFTISGYEDAVCPPGPRQSACRQSVEGTNNGGILASVVAGPRGQAAINHYVNAYQSITALAVTPTSLVNFGEAVNFPLIFGVILAAFGAATLLHVLVVSVSRRRREVGLLKVLGFVDRQVASVVVWQATTLAVVGVVIGVPLGVAIGQAVWRAFATNLGVVPVSVVPIWLVVGLAAGVIAVANLLAVTPALVASRSRPGQLLRTR